MIPLGGLLSQEWLLVKGLQLIPIFAIFYLKGNFLSDQPLVFFGLAFPYNRKRKYTFFAKPVKVFLA
jgi:hypothetical protein